MQIYPYFSNLNNNFTRFSLYSVSHLCLEALSEAHFQEPLLSVEQIALAERASEWLSGRNT